MGVICEEHPWRESRALNYRKDQDRCVALPFFYDPNQSHRVYEFPRSYCSVALGVIRRLCMSTPQNAALEAEFVQAVSDNAALSVVQQLVSVRAQRDSPVHKLIA